MFKGMYILAINNTTLSDFLNICVVFVIKFVPNSFQDY